ncbi:hypothetical protein GCM10027320_42330 [Massilia solisilvae]
MHWFARVSVCTFSVLAALPTVSVAETPSVSRYQDQNQLIRAPQALASLGTNLFGDKVNLYTGALEFIQTDVSLSGNSSLPVQMGRRLVAGVTASTDNTSFGNWDMEIPHLHGVFSEGWVDVHGNNSRCSVFGAPEPVGPDGTANFSAIEFWHGNFIYVPGYGDQEMLARRTGNTLAPGGNASQYPVVTRNNWQFSCLPSMKRGSGEGFLAIAPDGTTYQFDWMVARGLLKLTKSNPAPAPSVTDSELDPIPHAFPTRSIGRKYGSCQR